MGVDQSPLTGDIPGFIAEETHSGVALKDDLRSTGERGQQAIRELRGDNLGSAGRVRQKVLKHSWLPRGLEGTVRNLLGKGLQANLPKVHTWKYPLVRPCVLMCA